ncbi:MAG: mechanosensitive ion channel protein MscS [Marinilabiliales bacterium]|nr:MAG: mechanosensitive ion channel protein MscS [Marinilabiliales bacterium]
MNTEKIIEQLTAIAVEWGPRLLGALAVLIIGSIIIRLLTRAFKRAMKKSKVNISLQKFLANMFNIILRILLILSILGMVGIEMTSFIAILGAAGLAIGLALSGTLQNFAGGVLILLQKPYVVGDFIETPDGTGTVSEIQIFNTLLKTVDNKIIIIPNGPLSVSALTNFSAEPTRRVDWTFGIGYGDSSDKAKEVLRRLCDEDDRILKDPEVFIALSELGDSSVNFVVRAWVKSENYWDVFFDMNEKVYKTFTAEGLNIPFPQMDVHVHNS